MIILIGASSGIGKEIINELIKYDDVIATYNKNKINFVNKNKKKYYEFKLDISNEKNIQKFIKKIEKFLKNITFINLATTSIDKLICDLNSKDILKTFRINTFSNILFSKYIIKKMIRDKYGRFIFLSSTRALRGDIGISLYAITKTSLSSLSNCITKEYSKFGITSNVLSLGYFNTPLMRNINEKIKKKLIEQIPTQKLGKTKNITTVIKMIIKNKYVNNANISIDGGL